MGYFHFSRDESEIFGLNFGRGAINDHNWTAWDIRNEICECKYDMVRVKIRSDSPDVFEKLSELGFPYTVYSILLRNSIEIDGTESYSATDIEFEVFDGSQL